MAKGEKTGGRVAGTPNHATREIKELARQYGAKGVEELAKLAGLVEGETKAESDQARIIAIKELLDRGYGKAAQHVTQEDGPNRAASESERNARLAELIDKLGKGRVAGPAGGEAPGPGQDQFPILRNVH